MKEFSAIAKLPDVIGAVLSDHSGALLEWSGAVDGETAGAVNAFTVRGFSQVGELLGIGTLQRISIVGGTRASVITVQSDSILGTYTDPTKPIGNVERRLQETLPK
jgi:predicted regulator of Ras-like GTPase activity (Roadblock/LC7/MglB family)